MKTFYVYCSRALTPTSLTLLSPSPSGFLQFDFFYIIIVLGWLGYSRPFSLFPFKLLFLFLLFKTSVFLDIYM